MYKILIVEDEAPLLKILATKFSQSGFQVETANNGKAGIIKASSFFPDFILLDIIMPEMDGTTTLRHLKELPTLKDIPVAMLTALQEAVPESLHPNEEIRYKIVAYFMKDTTKLEEIVEFVKKYLTEHPRL